MTLNYNLVKSLVKGGKALLAFAIPAIPVAMAHMEIRDLTIIELISQLFPILSTLTVGGVITIIIDYFKHRDK